MTGGAMAKQISKEIERLTNHIGELKKEVITKEKSMKDVKVLLSVKDKVEETFNTTDNISLEID